MYCYYALRIIVQDRFQCNIHPTAMCLKAIWILPAPYAIILRRRRPLAEFPSGHSVQPLWQKLFLLYLIKPIAFQFNRTFLPINVLIWSEAA